MYEVQDIFRRAGSKQVILHRSLPEQPSACYLLQAYFALVAAVW